MSPLRALVVLVGLSLTLAACGDDPKAKAESSAKPAASGTAAATAAATSTAAAKKDDKGW